MKARQALEIDPTDPRVRQVAGTISFARGDWSDADEHFRVALHRDPLITLMRFDLGRVYYAAGRFVESEAEFRQVLERSPEFIWAHTYLGRTLLAQGRKEEALAIARRRAHLTDLAVELIYQAQALIQLGRLDEAERLLDEAAPLLPRIGDSRLVLAWIDVTPALPSPGLTSVCHS